MRSFIKSFAGVAVALLVLSSITTVATAFGGVIQNHGDSGAMGMVGKHGGDSSGLVQDGGMMNNTQEKAHMHQMMGETARLGLFRGFNQTGSQFDGRFLSFALNESNGALTNYTVVTIGGDVVVFKATGPIDFTPGNISLRGSLFVEEDMNVSIVVHDNPVALMHLTSTRTNERVYFNLGPGISAVVLPKMGNNTVDSYALVSGAGIQGILTAKNGTLSIESDGHGIFTITANASDVMFRMKPAFAKGHTALEGAVQDAIVDGRIAGELSLTFRNGSAMYDLMQYRMGFGLEVQQANQNHVRLAVSSNEHEGKVAIINLDQGTFDTQTGNDMTVTLDGNGIRQTRNPLEVLSASGSLNSDAVYCIESTDNGSQILVYIPSFSTHVLDLSSVPPLASILSVTGLLAVLGAMVAVGAAAFLLLGRKG
jgi:hypothetical protein